MHYPISVNIDGRKCVIIGGGRVAERKARALVRFGAEVLVQSPNLTPGLCEMVDNSAIRYVPGLYTPDVLEGAFLAIAATSNQDINRRAFLDACERGILINVVDRPDLCTFFVPAVVTRGELVISVSSSGKCPAMSAWMRKTLDASIGEEYGDLLALLAALRTEIRRRYKTVEERKAALSRVLNSDVLGLLSEKRVDEAIAKAQSCIM